MTERSCVSVFPLVLLILVLLLTNSRLGGSNRGCLVQLGLWFSIGVLLVPLLAISSCFCRPG